MAGLPLKLLTDTSASGMLLPGLAVSAINLQMFSKHFHTSGIRPYPSSRHASLYQLEEDCNSEISLQTHPSQVPHLSHMSPLLTVYVLVIDPISTIGTNHHIKIFSANTCFPSSICFILPIWNTRALPRLILGAVSCSLCTV